jgi:hypothetical protein
MNHLRGYTVQQIIQVSRASQLQASSKQFKASRARRRRHAPRGIATSSPFGQLRSFASSSFSTFTASQATMSSSETKPAEAHSMTPQDTSNAAPTSVEPSEQSVASANIQVDGSAEASPLKPAALAHNEELNPQGSVRPYSPEPDPISLYGEVSIPSPGILNLGGITYETAKTTQL